MKSSIYIAKIAGIKIFIHWTFFILLVWIIGSGIYSGDSREQIFFSVGFVLTIFTCVVLHELGHALMAKRFHFRTRDIILLPIGGMARMDELPEKPKQELLVAIAGPLVNIFIALILYPFVKFNANLTEIDKLEPNGSTFLFLLFLVNISLAVFNLIPAFPMDGGRILRALLSIWMDRLKATSIASYAGQIIALLFFILGIFNNPILVLIAIFVFITARAEREQVRSNYILQNYKVKDLVSQHFYKMDKSETMKEATRLLLDGQATSFLVTDEEKIVGILNRDEIIKCLAEKGEDAKVTEAMNSQVTFISEDASLNEAFKAFQTSKNKIMPVIKDHSFLGVLDLNNILELIMIRTAAGKHSQN